MIDVFSALSGSHQMQSGVRLSLEKPRSLISLRDLLYRSLAPFDVALGSFGHKMTVRQSRFNQYILECDGRQL